MTRSSHSETTTLAEAIAALNAEGITVIAFNRLDGAGITASTASYCGGDAQASTIATATGGSLTNNFGGLSGADFVNAVNGAIGSATSTLDLVFGTDFFASMRVGWRSRSPARTRSGCTGVGGGESRTFDVTITALAEGTYDFTIGADGVAAARRITSWSAPAARSFPSPRPG